MSGTHRDLLLWSRSRCFAWKNHTWRLGPMETSNSDARNAVLHAENHRWGLGPTETCYSGPEVAVLHAKTTGGVYSSAETCNSSPKVAVLHTQNHRWELEPIQSFILVLSTLLCVLKTTDEDWDPYRLVSLVQKSLFCMHKPQMRAGTHRD